MTPAFSIVTNLPETVIAPESVAQKVRRLQDEAAALAREQVAALERALEDITRLSQEIASGGEAYPVGAREIARRLAEDADASAKTLDIILSRH
jgi:hypothetical protein